MQTKTTVDLEKFKNVLGFSASFKRWGNSRRADIQQVQTDADKRRLKLSKQLIQADELDAIKSYMSDLQQWIYSRTVTGFKKGFQMASKEAYDIIEARMKKAVAEDLPPLVSALKLVYANKVEEARVALNGQFNPRDYPTEDQLDGLFGIDWLWIDFTPAQALTAEQRQAEAEKLQKKMLDAGEEIITALRTAFQELLAHALDRMTPGEDGKQKIFRDSMLGNIQEFLDTFSSRNLMNDTELAALVEKAKGVMLGADPEKIRKYSSVREATAKTFAEIKSQVDGMIETRKARAFDFS